MSRNEVFQQLKGPCVELSQAAFALAGKANSALDVISPLSKLHAVLASIESGHGAIDAKIAEYVFFPLSHILKASQKLSGRALELTLSNLNVLLRTGWKAGIPGDLAAQLLILLSYLASTSDAQGKPAFRSEELRSHAFDGLSALYQGLLGSPQASSAAFSTVNIPAYVNAVSVILEGMKSDPAPPIQLAATQALRSAVNATPDIDALANFLPGIVSTLAQVLTPSTNLQRHHKVLVIGLEILTVVLRRVMSDEQTTDLPVEDAMVRNDQASLAGQRTQSWVNATAGQVRQVLSSVLKLRHHSRVDVQRGILRLCTMIFIECKMSLKSCSGLALDTIMSLVSSDVRDEALLLLQQVLIDRPEVADDLKSDLYSWIISFPRVVATKDDAHRNALFAKASTTLQLLQEVGTSLVKIDTILANNLRDSIVAILRADRGNSRIAKSNFEQALNVVQQSSDRMIEQHFQPIIDVGSQHVDPTLPVRRFLAEVAVSQMGEKLANLLISTARRSSGQDRVASVWLARQLLHYSKEHDDQFADFLHVDDAPNNVVASTQDLYAVALSDLLDSTIDTSFEWRSSALALEVVVSAAQAQRIEFRPELIEVLYPMLHLIGSPNVALRSHALVALNVVAGACEYRAVSDMIIENVDYLVNAVSLKLNAFDLTPQAPQVLLMMVKLTGPALVPYLDDLVVSIFAALQSFHGYPKLVELLFGVLRAIAEEGAKSPLLTITGSETPSKADSSGPDSILTVLEDIKTLQLHAAERRSEEKAESFPEKAWGRESAADVDDQPSSQSQDATKPPAPKTYSLLLQISELTQHYLTSDSSTLRVSLLSLLRTTIPALAAHENSFLPFINTLWPVLVSRLDDIEGFIVADSIDIIALMCIHGRDFMRSRINELWPTLKNLLVRAGPGGLSTTFAVEARSLVNGLVMTRAQHNGSGNPIHSYIDYTSRTLSQSLLELLKAIVTHVHVDDEKFEEVLSILEPFLVNNREISEVLETRNADAVWLRLMRMRATSIVQTTVRKFGVWDFPAIGLV